MKAKTLKIPSIRLGALFLIVCVFGITFYMMPQVPASLYAVYLSWNAYSTNETPTAYVVPSQTLEIESNVKNQPTQETLRIGLVNIQIPRDVNYKEMHLDAGPVVIIFPEKGFVEVDQSLPDIKSGFVGRNNIDEHAFSELFGVDATASKFELHKSIMRITPNSFAWTNPPKENIAASILLPLKFLLADSERHGGYWLESKSFQGIQVGDPNQGDSRVFVNIYPFNDLHIRMVFEGFGQREINEFLSAISFNDMGRITNGSS